MTVFWNPLFYKFCKLFGKLKMYRANRSSSTMEPWSTSPLLIGLVNFISTKQTSYLSREAQVRAITYSNACCPDICYGKMVNPVCCHHIAIHPLLIPNPTSSLADFSPNPMLSLPGFRPFFFFFFTSLMHFARMTSVSTKEL